MANLLGRTLSTTSCFRGVVRIVQYDYRIGPGRVGWTTHRVTTSVCLRYIPYFFGSDPNKRLVTRFVRYRAHKQINLCFEVDPGVRGLISMYLGSKRSPQQSKYRYVSCSVRFMTRILNKSPRSASRPPLPQCQTDGPKIPETQKLFFTKVVVGDVGENIANRYLHETYV